MGVHSAPAVQMVATPEVHLQRCTMVPSIGLHVLTTVRLREAVTSKPMILSPAYLVLSESAMVHSRSLEKHAASSAVLPAVMDGASHCLTFHFKVRWSHHQMV